MSTTLHGPSLLPQSGNVRRIVIFLHGYGANGQNMFDLAHEFKPHFPDTLFLSPNAIEPSDIVPDGYQWFGLSDFNPFNIRQGLDKATPILIDYINTLKQTYHLSDQNIALVGFSQGAILALDTLFSKLTLGAIIGFSGAFYPPSVINAGLMANSVPVMLAHGTNDSVVPYAAMMQAQIALQSFGIAVQTLTCNGLEHSINYNGIVAGIDFLKSCWKFDKKDPS